MALDPSKSAADQESAVDTFGLQAVATKDFIVRFKPGKEGKKPRKGGKKRNLHLQRAQLFTAESEADAREMIEELNADDDVEFAEADTVKTLDLVPTDPQYGSQWALPKIGMPAAFNLTTGSATVKVAVIDTGVKYNHEDLSGQVLLGHDYYGNDEDPLDDSGHGTHVAGIIVATMNNAKGVAGIAPGCKVLAIKTGGGSSGGSLDSNNADAVGYAVAQGCKVINMSLGGSTGTATLRAAIDEAVAAGVVVVCSAGNDGSQNPHYPSSFESSMSVGSSGTTDARSSFSNYGPTVTIAAPGEGILNTLYTGGYGNFNGTSMATPHVAGAAALLCSLHPTWSVDQIRKALETTGAAVTGFTNTPALKRLNVLAALQAAQPTDTAATFNTVTASQANYSSLIRWNASEPVLPSITYGTSPTLVGGLTLSKSDPTTRPFFLLAGLLPGTPYYYRLSGTDPKGNVTTSAIASVTTTALALTSLKASTSAYSPVITWTSSVPTKHEVFIGLTSASLTSAGAASTVYETAHKNVLTGLIPGTTYYYQAKSTDASGNIKLSEVLSFKTSALAISAAMVKPNKYGLALTWLTNSPTNDLVQYGTSSASLTSSTALNTTQSTSHLVTFASLLPSTTYYYKLNGTDPFGNAVASAVLSFTTMPLAVSEIQVSRVSYTGAQINWRTNALTNHQVFYGLTNLVSSSQTLDTTLATAHQATFTGLTRNTTYYYQLRCKDTANNPINSGILMFKTLP